MTKLARHPRRASATAPADRRPRVYQTMVSCANRGARGSRSRAPAAARSKTVKHARLAGSNHKNGHNINLKSKMLGALSLKLCDCVWAHCLTHAHRSVHTRVHRARCRTRTEDARSRYLDGLVDVVRLGGDRPDGDLELGHADLAVAARVDRVEDGAQLLIGEAAAAGRARRPRARWIGRGSAEDRRSQGLSHAAVDYQAAVLDPWLPPPTTPTPTHPHPHPHPQPRAALGLGAGQLTAVAPEGGGSVPTRAEREGPRTCPRPAPRPAGASAAGRSPPPPPG